MKKLLIVVLAILPAVVFTQVTEEWVRRYDGPVNGEDRAWAIALDGSGSVYVTGSSVGSDTNWDYATVKYNSSGVEQWASRYNGPGDTTDYANAIALDGEANVYVTGWSVRSETNEDYATVKYDTSGVEQWVAHYDGPESGYDEASAIALDGEANVYVTGFSVGSETYSGDCATVKYNSSGVEQWVARYDGHYGHANAIALDGEANVCVTGYSIGSGTSSDYATVKYNSSGVEQWVSSYDGPGNEWDEASAIALDGAGNVYVTGRSKYGPAGVNYDYATIKYNSSGVQQWVARYDGPASDIDKAEAIALDDAGNVYVTGWSVGTSYDYATVKYDSSGVQQWVARYDGPPGDNDGAEAIALDGEANVYVTGWSFGSSTRKDYATVKYDSSGVQQWVARYDGPSYSQDSQDHAVAIAVDDTGNVYVTGRSTGLEGDDDYCTIKYSQPFYQPDNLVKNSDEPAYAGDDTYNTDGVDQTKSQMVDADDIVVYHISIENDGSAIDTFEVTGTPSNAGWIIAYFDALTGGADITADVTNSGWSTGELAQGSATKIRVEVTPPSTAPEGASFDVLVTSTSQGDDAKKDVVKVVTTVGTDAVEEPAENVPVFYLDVSGMGLRYGLPQACEVTIEIFDVSGRSALMPVSGKLQAGSYQMDLSSMNLLNGVYFCRMQTTGFSETEKLVVIR